MELVAFVNIWRCLHTTFAQKIITESQGQQDYTTIAATHRNHSLQLTIYLRNNEMMALCNERVL